MRINAVVRDAGQPVSSYMMHATISKTEVPHLNTVSLLYPNETPQCYQISRTIADDLGIPFLAEHITETSTERKVISDVLLQMPVSEEIIRYRQAVYSELRSDEALCTSNPNPSIRPSKRPCFSRTRANEAMMLSLFQQKWGHSAYCHIQYGVFISIIEANNLVFRCKDTKTIVIHEP